MTETADGRLAGQDGTTFAAACRAVADVLPRFTDLLRRNPAVSRTAVGRWTLPEAACHVSHVIEKDTDALLRNPLPHVELSPAAVSIWTESMLDEDPERDVNALADRIDALGSAFLDIGTSPPTEPVSWVGGTHLAPSAVACHLLEELLVHGFDVARAAREPWRIEPSYAALAITGAVVPIISASPQSWVRPNYDPRVRARIEIRLRRHGRFAMVLDDALSVEMPPASASADAYVSAAPEELLLVMLGRRSHWRALLGGGVMVWGRRPQALLALLGNTSPP
jgi:hypothetical protein